MTATSCIVRLNVGVLAAVIWVACPTQSHGEEPGASNAAAVEPLVELMQERRAVLEQLVKVQSESYQRGEAGFESVVTAREDLLHAELELETRREERIKLLETFVEVAAQWEKMVMQRYRAGHVSVADVLKGRALHLKAQVDLLRERRKEE